MLITDFKDFCSTSDDYLIHVAENNDIIVVPFDNNSGVVVISVEEYNRIAPQKLPVVKRTGPKPKSVKRKKTKKLTFLER